MPPGAGAAGAGAAAGAGRVSARAVVAGACCSTSGVAGRY
jgi:hypothetical protein